MQPRRATSTSEILQGICQTIVFWVRAAVASGPGLVQQGEAWGGHKQECSFKKGADEFAFLVKAAASGGP